MPDCLYQRGCYQDDTRNSGWQIMRLKEKLGDRSNASSEVEYRGALGQLVGEEGRGIAAIMNMVALTRADCVLGSAGQVGNVPCVCLPCYFDCLQPATVVSGECN